MPIPDYQSIMRPLLEFAAAAPERTFRNAVEHIAQRFQLTEAERQELIPSRGQPC
jgi:restriction system protein